MTWHGLIGFRVVSGNELLPWVFPDKISVDEWVARMQMKHEVFDEEKREYKVFHEKMK